MKAIIIIITSCFTLYLSAQKVELDRYEKDGRRQIMTTTKTVSMNNHQYNFGIKAFQGITETDWLLLVTSYSTIADNTILLIKLGNDDIINLPVNNIKVSDHQTNSYIINYGSISTVTPSITIHYYSSVFVLSQYDMDRIDQYGISKIRISAENSFREKTFSKNQLGKFLTKSRKLIRDAYLVNSTKQNIYDNF